MRQTLKKKVLLNSKFHCSNNQYITNFMKKTFFIGEPNRTEYNIVPEKSTKKDNITIDDILDAIFPGVREKKEVKNDDPFRKYRSERVGSFAILNDDLNILEELVAIVASRGLTVAGDGSRRADSETGSVHNAYKRPYSIITVGLSEKFDVDWKPVGNNIPKDVPLYSLRYDAEAISSAFASFIVEKRELASEYRDKSHTLREMKLNKLYSTEKKEEKKYKVENDISTIITVTDQFIKIGYDFIPYNPETDDAEEIIANFVTTRKLNL